MGTQEKGFLKWFAGIAAVVIAGQLLIFLGTVSHVDVIEAKTIENSNDVIDTKIIMYQQKNDLKEFHNNDNHAIKQSLSDIKSTQKIIQGDIKKLLERK